MAEPRFQEDFFQRIKDVKWESEPKVYWMAGTGSGIARETAGGGDNGTEFGSVWTSSDGIHWDGGETGEIEFGGAFGVWMREGFKKEGRPVWLMPGQAKKARSALYISTDGRSAYVKGFDRGHHIDDLKKVDSQLKMLQHNFWAVDKGGGANHMETFTSSNGISWSPERFHAEESPDTGGSFMAAEMAVYGPAKPRTVHETNPGVVTVDAPPGLLLRRQSIITPLAAQQTAPSDQNQVYQRSTGPAFGKIRKGPLAGEKISMSLMGGKSGHGGYNEGMVEIRVIDTGEIISGNKTHTGVEVGNTGLSKTWCIGYGHYVFAVGGMVSGQGGGGAIAYTEDGIEWQTTGQGKAGYGFWTMAVGARE